MASTTYRESQLGMPWPLPARNAPPSPRAVGPPLPPVEPHAPGIARVRGGQRMLDWRRALKADTPEQGAEQFLILLAHHIVQASQSQGHVQQLASDLRQNAHVLAQMIVP